MNVRWSSKAAADFERISDYLLDHAPSAAERIVLQIYSSVKSLSDMPFKGRATSKPRTRQLILPEIRYVITYRVTGTMIEVIRIRHGSQKPLRN